MAVLQCWIKPAFRRQTGVAGTWQGWRTGALGTGIPVGIPTKARHRNRRTNGVSNGRKKAAIMAGVRQCIRVAKPGRAIERDGVMVRESSGAVKHVIHILRLSGAFHRDIMALDGWNCFCRTQGPGGGLLFWLKECMAFLGKFSWCPCPKCGGFYKVRTSRKVIARYIEYYTYCGKCGSKRKFTRRFEDVVWPSPDMSEKAVREKYSAAHVRSAMDEVQFTYHDKKQLLSEELEKLERQVKFFKEKLKSHQKEYDLLMAIAADK
ncbi:hypothetical protein K5M36_03325 [Chromobacterium vaccinii]|nr:hypothetical protein [Chromobacterium vaccinii]